jgi:hypothetical protein
MPRIKQKIDHTDAAFFKAHSRIQHLRKQLDNLHQLMSTDEYERFYTQRLLKLTVENIKEEQRGNKG